MSDGQYEAAGELLRVLSAPLRLAIITRLAQGPATVSALTAEVGHSQPLVSQHLRILRSVRLVHATTDGRERIYELVDDHVAHIVADAIRHTAEPGHAESASNEPASKEPTHAGSASKPRSTIAGATAARDDSSRTPRSGTNRAAPNGAAIQRSARARASSVRSPRKGTP